jgi:hypothetical protein
MDYSPLRVRRNDVSGYVRPAGSSGDAAPRL